MNLNYSFSFIKKMLATYLHKYTLMLLIVSLLFMESFKEGSTSICF